VKERINKLNEIKNTKSLDAFLFTSPASIKCFSGYFYNFETGPSPSHLLPAALFISPFQKISLLVADSEIDKLTALHPHVFAAKYSSCVYEESLHFSEDFLLQLLIFIKTNDAENATIGIEKNTFPYSLFIALSEQYPGIKFTDITDELNYVKTIKDEDEIELIRKAANLSDVGQAAVLHYAKKGITELDLFSKVRLAIETTVGARVPMMTDLVCGKSTASGGGNPTNKIINKNDLILCQKKKIYVGKGSIGSRRATSCSL
jgi:Xaa-Pro dipeptidase